MTRTLRTAAVTAAFLLLSASSCTTMQQFAHTGQPRLQVVGDSITVLSTPDINSQFGSGYDVAIHATVGFDTLLQAPDIARQAQDPPAVEVIELGTNDAHELAGSQWYKTDTTLDGIEGRFDTFASEFPPSTCVVFVTVNSHVAGWGSTYAAEINAHLRTFAHVADWDAAWNASYFDRADDPHPNAAGRQALVALEAGAVDSCT